VRLEQVACNLLQNAIKYTPRGGRLWVSVETAGDQALLRVRDTGIGLAPEMLQAIFEPFSQVESSRQHSEGGLGLGLPLVRSLVEMHGGRVEAVSDGTGRGSEFVVRLPLLAEDRRTAASRRQAPPRLVRRRAEEASGVHILIVEDNEDGRESLRELLELWGHHVSVAGNGPEGVEMAFSVRPEVALIDIGLPGLDGNEVARRIRELLGGDDIALIAMTGYGQPEDRRRALQAGFDRYLVKPVDPAELSRLLGEARQGDEARQAS
jgi:CheY-like chemotaxis protein